MTFIMKVDRISVSLPHNAMRFIGAYQKTHSCKSRSEVVHKALSLLQEIELEKAYQEAAKETDSAFEITISDGLQNETW